MSRYSLCFLASLAFLVPGCHLVLGPEDGQDWWYYCDSSGCYRCTPEGCEIEGGNSCSEGTTFCPTGTYCDPASGTCRRKSCSVAADCGAGNICVSGYCNPFTPPCSSNSSCGDGAYCKNGTCVNTKRCGSDADCASLGSYVCDTRGTCVPGTPVDPTCKTATTCAGGMCLDGKCGTCSSDCGGGKTCQFNKHCATGKVCLDAQCTNSCTADSQCGTAQKCQSKVCVASNLPYCEVSATCGSGKICVNNVCYPDCSSTQKCSNTADTCSQTVAVSSSSYRFCYANHSAKTECKVTKDCLGGEVCVNGLCRTSCTKTEDCAACADGPVCGTGGYCMTSAEASPECAKSADCTGGKVCLDAKCTTL